MRLFFCVTEYTGKTQKSGRGQVVCRKMSSAPYRSKKEKPGHSYQKRLQDNPPHDLLLHSWFDHTAHIVRMKSKAQQGRLCRCEIKELEVNPEDGNVRLRVQFNDGKEGFVSKMVSPLSLLLAQVYVCFQKAVSEDDEDLAAHQVFPVTQRLPPLLCSNATDVFRGASGAACMRKLQATLKEVNEHQAFLAKQPEVDNVFDFEAFQPHATATTTTSTGKPSVTT
jgi:hypothetical protein